MNDTALKIKAAKLGFSEKDLERENLSEIVEDVEKFLASDDECFPDDFDLEDEDCKTCSYASVCESVFNARERQRLILNDDDEGEDEEDETVDDEDDKVAIAEAVQKRTEVGGSSFVNKKSWYKPKYETDRFGFREDSKLSFVANLMFYGKHTREQILSLAEEKYDTLPENRKGLLNNAQNHLKARGFTVRTDRASGVVRITDIPSVED